jgi:hypothetical protein
LNPQRISTIFLGSDIISFLIQAGGSGFAVQNNNTTAKIGADILLAGMALNFASFTVFVSLVAYFDWATSKAYNEVRLERRFYPIVRALYISWVFIMVRLFMEVNLR